MWGHTPSGTLYRQYRLSHAPASASFPLFGVGQADPLLRHGADVVVGVEVGLLNFASIYHEDDVVYGDAARKSRGRQMRQTEKRDRFRQNSKKDFKGGLSKKKKSIADTHTREKKK